MILASVAEAAPKASSVTVTPTSATLGSPISIRVNITKASNETWVGGVAYVYAKPPSGTETLAGTISSGAFSSTNFANLAYAPPSSGSWQFRAQIVGTYQVGSSFLPVDSSMTAYKTATVAGGNLAPTIGSIFTSPPSPIP